MIILTPKSAIYFVIELLIMMVLIRLARDFYNFGDKNFREFREMKFSISTFVKKFEEGVKLVFIERYN